MEIDISSSGFVESAEVVESCAADGFKSRALSDVREWKFKPTEERREDVELRMCRP